jgi:Flp pilus assembly protein TadG
MAPRRNRPAKQDLGQTLVEFALVFPVLLLLIFGIIDVGRYVYVANSFNEAAREGARFGSVAQWQYSCPASVPLANQDRFTCTSAVALGRIGGAPAYVNTPLTITCLQTPDDPSSAVAAADCRAGYLLTVVVQTATSPANKQFHFLTPVIGQILGSPTITGQASVVVQ